MTLGKWAKAQQLELPALARRLGKPKETVRLWLLGRAMPTRRHLVMIGKVTRGEVTANDFMGRQ